MPHWRNIDGYTKNTLLHDFAGRGLFSRQDFIRRGGQEYSLKQSTCEQKLQRGIREGFLKSRGEYFYYAAQPGWQVIEDYNRCTLVEDFRNWLFFRWQDFWYQGKIVYGLKKSTCRQKLWWAQREGMVEKRSRLYFCKI